METPVQTTYQRENHYFISRSCFTSSSSFTRWVGHLLLHRTDDERGAFASYIARNPSAGDVVPESGDIRKVRWSRAGSGKSGGVRVIYFTRNAEGEVVLLTLYAKSTTDNLTGHKLKEIRHALEE